MTQAARAELLEIVTIVKYAPAPAAGRFSSDLTTDRRAPGARLSALDAGAIEQALRVAEVHGHARITHLTMGPGPAVMGLLHALAIGGERGVHVVDPALHGSDAPATSLVLAAALRHIGFDLVLSGAVSLDAGMGVVPAMLAERLDIAHVWEAATVEIDGHRMRALREHDLVAEVVEADLPASVTVSQRAPRPRRPSLRTMAALRDRPVETLDLATLEIDARQVGLAGARGIVVSIAENVPDRARRVVADEGRGGIELAEFLAAHRFI